MSSFTSSDSDSVTNSNPNTTTTSSSSSVFESAREDDLETESASTEEEDDAIFENSDYGEEEEDPEANGEEEERSDDPPAQATATSSSGVGRTVSKEEEKTAWSKLPRGASAICQQATGLLYMERYKSFLSHNWPYHVKRGNLCHPKALAMAGLGFYSLEPSPSAQCQVCLTVLRDLKKDSNPWILHSEANPSCLLVELGQRQEVDDYTMDELLAMVYRKLYNVAEKKLKDRENILRKQLKALRELELKREKENLESEPASSF